MAPEPRGGFVTGLAWTFIVLGILAVLGTLPLAALWWFVIDPVAFEAALDEALQAVPTPVPPGVLWTLHNLKTVLTAGFAVSLVTLVAAVGLLRRQGWARVVFVWLMALGALIHVVWAVAPYLPGMPALDGGFMLVMALGSSLFALVFGALYGWLTMVLMSPAVRAEFA